MLNELFFQTQKNVEKKKLSENEMNRRKKIALRKNIKKKIVIELSPLGFHPTKNDIYMLAFIYIYIISTKIILLQILFIDEMFWLFLFYFQTQVRE